MSHPILSQTFPNSIANFPHTLQFFDNNRQNSFAQVNYQQSFPMYNHQNTRFKYEEDSLLPASPTMFKYNNITPLSFIDTQTNSTEVNSPTTTAMTRCDSKDEDHDDLPQKIKSPVYHEIDSKGILRGQNIENEHGPVILNERSKKILKRRNYKETDEANSDSSSKKNAKKGKRSSWSAHEDAKLMELMNTFGKKWSKIAAMMEGRTGKQVRDRYVNVLMPDINRTGWEESEDQLILSTYQQIGPKWSKIAENLQGRTEGQVKNRFYSFLKKKFGKEESINSPNGFEENYFLNMQKIERSVKVDNQEYNILQQCLQRVEEISQTSFCGQKYPQVKELNQFNNQNSYFPYYSYQKDYYTGNYTAPQCSAKMVDPTDVISFDHLTSDEAPSSHLNYYLTEY